jgi:hypothetical protein
VVRRPDPLDAPGAESGMRCRIGDVVFVAGVKAAH